jgi:three-Cys-motif partner protein
MSHQSHLWTPGSKPPTIRAHSVEKHKLLGAYIERYVATLTQNIRVESLPLTLVEGFAGGNIYTDEITGELRPGSPTIILNAMREAERLANEKRNKPFKIIDHYFFIEKETGAFESLQTTLRTSGYAKQIGDNIILINDDFTAHFARIIEFINKKSRRGRSIFILDQCGYSGVPFTCIRNILDSVQNAEIILTFAADHLIDYLQNERTNRKLLNNPELDLDSLGAKLEKTDPRWRRLIQLELHAEVQRNTNARFFTPFFIHSKDSHRDLWLVHLSRHHRARDVMVGVHWQHQNSFAHFGKPGLRMLGYDPDEDVLVTGQPYFPGFYFDGKARALTKEALCEELPKLICDNFQCVDFKSLFSSISNGTPATSQILREVLHELANDSRVTIKDESCSKLRRAGIQHESDVIYVHRQTRLF